MDVRQSPLSWPRDITVSISIQCCFNLQCFPCDNIIMSKEYSLSLWVSDDNVHCWHTCYATTVFLSFFTIWHVSVSVVIVTCVLASGKGVSQCVHFCHSYVKTVLDFCLNSWQRPSLLPWLQRSLIVFLSAQKSQPLSLSCDRGSPSYVTT